MSRVAAYPQGTASRGRDRSSACDVLFVNATQIWGVSDGL
jgi:hypothetical protein